MPKTKTTDAHKSDYFDYLRGKFAMFEMYEQMLNDTHDARMKASEEMRNFYEELQDLSCMVFGLGINCGVYDDGWYHMTPEARQRESEVQA